VRTVVEEMAAKIAFGQKIKYKGMEVPDRLAKEWFREYVRLVVERHGPDAAQRLFAYTRGNFAEPMVEEAARRFGMPYEKLPRDKLFGEGRRW
jgi:hypothetical protein